MPMSPQLCHRPRKFCIPTVTVEVRTVCYQLVTVTMAHVEIKFRSHRTYIFHTHTHEKLRSVE